MWHGTGRAGRGSLSSDSGVLSDTPYSFRTRLENEKGTNPEELIAAAHAGCFTMALAFGRRPQVSRRRSSRPRPRLRWIKTGRHPEPAAYAKKFSGKYLHRLVSRE